MHRLCYLLCLLLALTVRGQRAPAGVPLGERFDVTGDGIADLIITGETKQLDDPEMGKGGIHTVWLEPLPGKALLFRCTPNGSVFYQVVAGLTRSLEHHPHRPPPRPSRRLQDVQAGGRVLEEQHALTPTSL